MKNLCFIDFNISNVGGIERVLVSLCNELSEMYNVHIVSICGDVKDCHYNINSNIKCYSLGNPSESRIRGLIVKSSKKLIDYVRENDIDVVFMVGHFTPPIVLPIKPFVNSKFVFCDHGALMNQYDDKKAVIFRKLASKLCDKTVVLTERTLNDYIRAVVVVGEGVVDLVDDNLDLGLGGNGIILSDNAAVLSIGDGELDGVHAAVGDIAVKSQSLVVLACKNLAILVPLVCVTQTGVLFSARGEDDFLSVIILGDVLGNGDSHGSDAALEEDAVIIGHSHFGICLYLSSSDGIVNDEEPAVLGVAVARGSNDSVAIGLTHGDSDVSELVAAVGVTAEGVVVSSPLSGVGHVLGHDIL